MHNIQSSEKIYNISDLDTVGSSEQDDLLHFVAFFHLASLLSTLVDNKKVGVDDEKALELTNSSFLYAMKRF